MSDQSNLRSTAKGYFLLALGVLVTLIIMVFIEVQVSLSKIDPENPETWTNMPPGMMYFLIPVLFLPLYLCSAFVVFICEKFIQRTKHNSWFFQGIGCAMITSFLPLSWQSIPPAIGISVPIILTILSVTIVRMKYRNE